MSTWKEQRHGLSPRTSRRNTASGPLTLSPGNPRRTSARQPRCVVSATTFLVTRYSSHRQSARCPRTWWDGADNQAHRVGSLTW